MADEPTSALARVEPTALAVTETSTAALSARSRAEVEARYLIALRNPRNVDQVRQDLLADCKRPRFAEAARYRKPVGGQTIEGPSARFAEAACRAMRNLDVSSVVTFDDPERRTVEVSAADLEANVRHSVDVSITKTVERKFPKKGRPILGTRTNSNGEPVYIVEATADELETKVAAAVSKARRNVILLHLPADIVDECQDLCIRVQEQQDKTDPTAARKRLLDALADVGVRAQDVHEYLGHDPGTLSPAELAELRAVWAALSEKAATWKDLLDAKREERAPATPQDKPAAAKEKPAQTSANKAKATLERVKAEQAAKREAKAATANGEQAAPSGEQNAPPGEQAAPATADGQQKGGKKRGRPKGSKNKPKPAAAAPPSEPQSPPAEPPPEREAGDDSAEPGMDPADPGWG
jgi:hypothetical protein